VISAGKAARVRVQRLAAGELPAEGAEAGEVPPEGAPGRDRPAFRASPPPSVPGL